MNEKKYFDKIKAFSNLEIFQAVNDHDFLKDWTIGRDMGKNGGRMGWGIGTVREHLRCLNYFLVFFFFCVCVCVLMQLIIIFIASVTL